MIIWSAYQWGRAVWAFDHDGGVWVQGFAAIVSAAVTIVLAVITYQSLNISRKAVKAALEQAAESAKQSLQSQQQLLLMAYPNAIMKVATTAYSHEISVRIKNNGAYPFKITNSSMSVSAGDSTHTTEFPLDGITVSSGDTIVHSEVPQVRNVTSQPLQVVISVDCKDVLGLVTVTYSRTEYVAFSDKIAI